MRAPCTTRSILPIAALALALEASGCGGELVLPPPGGSDGAVSLGADGQGATAADGGAQGPSCASFEHPFNGRCYSVVGLGWMDYASAAKLCANHKATVASILSAAENTFINGLLTSATQAAWIGLRRGAGGAFGWVDGQPLAYTRWAPGEPSSTAEGCAVIWGPGLTLPDLRGKWNDAPCNKPGRDTVICKR